MFGAKSAEDLFYKTLDMYKKNPESYLISGMKKRSLDSNLKMLKCMQTCGFTYFFAVTLIIFSCAFITMPVVYEYDITALRHRQVLSMVILFEILANFYLTCTKRGFYEPVKNLSHGQVNPQPEWKMCKDCDHAMPPRTHHCSLCRKCVLKRDHHCFFIGCCVGFENQRYFIVFCFYCAVASLYGLYVNCHFMGIMYGWSTGIINYFLPVTMVEWLFGYADLNFLFYTFITYVCAITSFGTAGIFIWQFFIAFWGSTTYEFFHCIKSHRNGILGPIRSVFGSYWMVNFIIPLTCMKQPGNGIDWGMTKTI